MYLFAIFNHQDNRNTETPIGSKNNGNWSSGNKIGTTPLDNICYNFYMDASTLMLIIGIITAIAGIAALVAAYQNRVKTLTEHIDQQTQLAVRNIKPIWHWNAGFWI